MKTTHLMHGISLVALTFLGFVSALGVYYSVSGIQPTGTVGTPVHFSATGLAPDDTSSESCSDPDEDPSTLTFRTQSSRLCSVTGPEALGPQHIRDMYIGQTPYLNKSSTSKCSIKNKADADGDGLCGEDLDTGECLAGTYECGYYRPDGINKRSLILNGDCNDYDSGMKGNYEGFKKPQFACGGFDSDGDPMGYYSCHSGLRECLEVVKEKVTYGNGTIERTHTKRGKRCTAYFPELDFNDSGTVSTEDIQALQTYVRDNKLTSNVDPDKTEACNSSFGTNKNCDVGGGTFLDRHDPLLIRGVISNPQRYLDGSHCIYGLDTNCDGVVDVACGETIDTSNQGGTSSMPANTNNNQPQSPTYQQQPIQQLTPPTNNYGTVQLPSSTTNSNTSSPTLYNPGATNNYNSTTNGYTTSPSYGTTNGFNSNTTTSPTYSNTNTTTNTNTVTAPTYSNTNTATNTNTITAPSYSNTNTVTYPTYPSNTNSYTNTTTLPSYGNTSTTTSPTNINNLVDSYYNSTNSNTTTTAPSIDSFYFRYLQNTSNKSFFN